MQDETRKTILLKKRGDFDDGSSAPGPLGDLLVRPENEAVVRSPRVVGDGEEPVSEGRVAHRKFEEERIFQSFRRPRPVLDCAVICCI